MDTTMSSRYLRSSTALYLLYTCVITLQHLSSTCCQAASVTPSTCEPGQFLSRTLAQCVDCSQCPLNEIVRRPCSEYRDTQCGPFYEFEFFHQGGKDGADSDGGNDAGVGGDGDTKSQFNLFAAHLSTRRPAGAGHSGKAAVSAGNGNQAARSQREDTGEENGISINVPLRADESSKWRELCFGLMAGLALLSCLFVAYIAYTQVQIHRLTAKTKLHDSTESREEPIYCYTQMFTEDQSESSKTAKHASTVRLANQIYRPGGARKINIINGRALPNEYIKHLRESGVDIEHLQEQNNLLPVIPEGSATDTDHVRVLYTTSQK